MHVCLNATLVCLHATLVCLHVYVCLYATQVVSQARTLSCQDHVAITAL